jgi:hypothetical protein
MKKNKYCFENVLSLIEIIIRNINISYRIIVASLQQDSVLDFVNLAESHKFFHVKKKIIE